MGLTYPEISPIMLQIGPIAIRWYSMAYLFGIVFGWLLIRHYVKKYGLRLSSAQLEDFVFYLTLGIILGGRVGYVLFYGEKVFQDNWFEVFAIWKGGMSFHGGALGVIVAMALFARKYRFPFLQLADLVVLVAPIGLFLGRIANFVNDELWGRVTDVPWAVRFPSGGFLPRHPSQLYESFLEGICLFVILNLLWRKEGVRKHCGTVSALFVLLYGIFRILMEQFREPDAHMGFFFGNFTMGQLLSVPLILLGIVVLIFVWRKPRVD